MKTEMVTPVIEANGARIPAFGLGTWDLRGRTCVRMVDQALRLGYRHIDTAAMYDNEREVGEGLRASGVPRAAMFVTTKVWSTHLAAGDFERSAEASLAKLKLEQVDLLLIHWPNPRIPLTETMSALCKMKARGIARHIGISNFTVALVEEAVRLATEPVVTNQIEWHPFNDPSDVRKACRKYGLSVTAYSPLARGRVAHNKTLAAIGVRHRKEASQIALRFLLQEGAIVIPRTAKPGRLASNFAVFDFELTDSEMREIRKLGR